MEGSMMEGTAFCETNQVRQVKAWIVLDFPSNATAVCVMTDKDS